MKQSQGRRSVNNQTSYNRRNMQRVAYVEGNAVRKSDPARELQRQPKKLSNTTRKNRDKMLHMNLPYVMFLTVAMVFAGAMLISYLQVQAKLTRSIRQVATLESTLNDLKLSNDEELERINSSIDMAQIKKIAVEELGMTYAKEGQVVVISGEGSDYVRQYVELP